MKNISRFKIDKTILIPLIIFIIISISSIYSAQSLLPSYMQNLYLKQIIFFTLGFGIIYLLMFLGNEFLYRNIYIIYTIGIISLILVLILGTTVKGSTSWFSIPNIGTIQPSEFMKIILILVLGRVINDFHEDHQSPSLKQEFILLLKIAGLILIPSILTFLQPDTGIVLIYLFIAFIMLLISGIRYRWLIIIFSILSITLGILMYIFFTNQDLFINIFGTSFFYRIDRLLDWSSSSGMQLKNSLMAIGSANITGYGFNKTPIYFPESQTDFIFTIIASNYGLMGALLLIIVIIFFDLRIISIANKSNTTINKLILGGIVAMLFYQQLQNIGMTISLLPITGITLPFISYGGSSLLSYMIIIGIIFNVSNENMRYTN